jgi:hypothetical protein
VVLSTSDYNQKLAAFLVASTYRILPKNQTEAMEQKTTLRLKKSSLSEVVEQLRPQGSRPPRLCRHLKFHMEGAPIRFCCEYHPGPNLPFGPTSGQSAQRIPGEFIHTIKSLFAGPENILDSFDFIFLITGVPIGEAQCLLIKIS